MIVGAGIFGVTAALALRARGHRVSLIDPGPIPHPLAASTDISKVIRIEYGPDEEYMALGERARDGWLAWNDHWGERLYHETGVLMVSREPFARGEFECDSHELLLKRGHRPDRMNSAELARRFPAWNAARYPDGFYHAIGGFAESGKVVERLLADSRAAGVEFFEGEQYLRWTEAGGKITGIECASGRRIGGEHLLLAGGAWAHLLHPELRECFRPVGQPVFHLRPADPEPFRAGRFPVFTADVARTGWYGFPVNATGVVKIANHGPGRIVHPDAPREVTKEDEKRLRAFLADTFPALADAPVVYTRLCLYSDTWDGHFWIARDPARAGLTLATGGSGHAFKFAPVLGGLAADAVEGKRNAYSEKFRWRPEVRPAIGSEAARFYGNPGHDS